MLLLIIYMVVGDRLPKQIFFAGTLTVALFWASISSFKRSRYSDIRFWGIMGCFLVLHIILMAILIHMGIQFTFREFLVIAAVEGLPITFGTAFILSGKDCLDEFD